MEGEGDALVGNTTWQLSLHPTSTSGANLKTTRDSLHVKQTGFYIRLHKGSMHTLTIYYLSVSLTRRIYNISNLNKH